MPSRGLGQIIGRHQDEITVGKGFSLPVQILAEAIGGLHTERVQKSDRTDQFRFKDEIIGLEDDRNAAQVSQFDQIGHEWAIGNPVQDQQIAGSNVNVAGKIIGGAQGAGNIMQRQLLLMV